MIRGVALGAGCSETQPYSLHGEAGLDLLRLPPDHPWRQAVRVQNPMHAEQALLRTTLAVGLLRSLSVNARHQRAAASLFEIGRVFRPTKEGRPDEPVHLGLAGYGELESGDWTGPGRIWDFFTLKGLVEELLRRAGLAGDADWRPCVAQAYPHLHPGRSAEVWLADLTRPVGWAGEVHPAITSALDIPGRALLAELDLQALAPLAQLGRRAAPLPRFPAAHRDLAVLAAGGVPAATVVQTIRQAGQGLLSEVRLFDVYTGQGIPEGTRSLAFALTYRAEDRTLTDAEVERVHGAIRRAVSATPGLEPR